MQSDTELTSAITAIRDGRKKEGQALLARILQKSPRNERAWLLLATSMDDPAKRRDCIQRALAINPESELGQKMLAALEKPIESKEVATEAPAQVKDGQATWRERRIRRMKIRLAIGLGIIVLAGLCWAISELLKMLG